MSLYRFFSKVSIGTKVTLSICLFALFTGLFTYRMGCNPALKNKCKGYNIITGKVYAYTLPKQQCKKMRLKYCYSDKPYIVAHYGPKNQTCQFVSGNVFAPHSDQTDADEYKIGKSYTLLQSQEDKQHCYTLEAVQTSWYFSTCFLFAAAVGLAFVVRSLVVEYFEIAATASGYVSIRDAESRGMDSISDLDSLKRNDSLFVFRNTTVSGGVGVERREHEGIEMSEQSSPNKATNS